MRQITERIPMKVITLIIAMCFCVTMGGCSDRRDNDGAQGSESKSTQSAGSGITIRLADGEHQDPDRQASKDKTAVFPVAFTIQASQTLETDGAVKVEREGENIRVTVMSDVALPGKASNDGCWVKVKNGEVVGCRNDGNCSKNCLLRSYNGYYYCVCGNQ
jgi:hypothetical protein